MKGKLLAFGVSLLAMATIGVVQLQSKAVDNSRDCDQYAVIRCGTLNREELQNEFETNGKSNDNGYATEQADIKKVFNAMGITRADLDLRVEQGVVYKDGSVKVGDKTVATNAKMAARGLGGTQIEGTNAQKVSVSAMSEAQTAMVFYKDGKFAFAVMKPCGNPVSATPKEEPQPEPTPVAKCVGVTATMQERNKYSITATAEVSGGAKIKGYTFVTTTNGKTVFNNSYDSTATSQSVVYQDLAPGTYEVKATIHTSEGVKGGPDCKTTFTVAPEPTPPTPVQTPGVDIVKYFDQNKATKYKRVNADVVFNYYVTVTNTGTVDLDNVLVTDTPDQRITLMGVTPPAGASIKDNKLTATISKLLKGESRTFIITAKVPVASAGMIPNTVCVDAPGVPGTPDKCDKADVEVPPTPVPGKIEVCLKDEDRYVQITEAEYNDQIHSRNPEDCKKVETPTTPTELPQTGPAETAMSVLGAVSLVGASAYYVASRRHV